MRPGPRLGDPERVHQQPLERQAPPQMGLRPPPSRELDDVVSISGTLTHTYGQPLLERPIIWQICPKIGSWNNANGNCVSQTNLRPNRARTASHNPGYDQTNPKLVCLAAIFGAGARPKSPAWRRQGSAWRGANMHTLRVLRATGVLGSYTRLRFLLRQHCWSRAENTRWGCSVENSASPHTAGVFGIRQ